MIFRLFPGLLHFLELGILDVVVVVLLAGVALLLCTLCALCALVPRGTRLAQGRNLLTGVRVGAAINACDEVGALAVDVCVSVEVTVSTELFDEVNLNLEAVAWLCRYFDVFRANADGDLTGAGLADDVAVDRNDAGAELDAAVANDYLTAALRTVSGSIKAENIYGEKITLRSVSGDMSAQGCSYDTYRINTVSGQVDLALSRPFEKLDGISVSGNIRLFAPMDCANAALRSVSGRLLTRGVSIQPEAPVARVSSVNGNLEINCSTAATYEEE